MKEILSSISGRCAVDPERVMPVLNRVKENWLEVLGWAFIPGAVIALAFSSIALATPLGALGTFFFVHAKRNSDKKEQIARKEEGLSQFYLDSCLDAYEKASDLLRDGNNNRAKWVHAGRILMLAKDLEKNITQESHLRVFEVHRLKYRYFFSEVIDKPGIHFYGVSSSVMKEISKLDRVKMLDEAEERSRKWQFSNNPYEKHDPDVYPLPEEALYAVWQASQWPYGHPEPLEGLKFSEEDRTKIHFSGIEEYLDHKEVKRARDLKK